MNIARVLPSNSQDAGRASGRRGICLPIVVLRRCSLGLTGRDAGLRVPAYLPPAFALAGPNQRKELFQ